jgi:hypothetical protein
VTAPRAVGVRLPYEGVPARVRAWVEETLGSAVVATAEQVGGMSPGCATRLTCADGTRAFVKAVGVERNPDTPGLFRREIAVLTALGRHELWARLLASWDDGDWVALLIEDVEGTHPDFTDDTDLDAVLAATDRLTGVLGRPGRHLGRPPEVGRLPRGTRERAPRDAGPGLAPRRPRRVGHRAA